MADLPPVTLDEMYTEVRRELDMRARLYPDWKKNAGRNKRNQLDRQFDVMQAVLDHLQAERDSKGETTNG